MQELTSSHSVVLFRIGRNLDVQEVVLTKEGQTVIAAVVGVVITHVARRIGVTVGGAGMNGRAKDSRSSGGSVDNTRAREKERDRDRDRDRDRLKERDRDKRYRKLSYSSPPLSRREPS